MLSRARANYSKHIDSGSSESRARSFVFIDASDKHRGLVVTQVPPEDIGQPLAIQRHQPLAFLGGSFSEA